MFHLNDVELSRAYAQHNGKLEIGINMHPCESYMSRRLDKEFADLENRPDPEDRFFVDRRYATRAHSRAREKPTWDCIIFIQNDKTAYRDACVTVTLRFGTEYPFKHPSVSVNTVFYHPYIHPDGTICRKILKHYWWQVAEDTGRPTNNTVRWLLGFLHDMLVDEGQEVDSVPHVCGMGVDVKDTRDHRYMMFDKIIQRVLGRELLDDERVEDRQEREEYSWSDLGTWQGEIDTQTKLNNIQLGMMLELFGGSHPGLQTITQWYLGIEPGGIGERSKFTSLHTLEEVRALRAKVTLISSDGKRITTRKWSCLHLFDQMEGEIPIPFDSDKIIQVLALCRPQNAFELRVYNPTTALPEMSKTLVPKSMADIVNIAKTADFMSADRIVHECCLELSQRIKRESRTKMQEMFPKSTFKTYVT